MKPYFALPLLLLVTACSSSSSNANDADASSVITDCSAAQAQPFDDAGRCFEATVSVDGICRSHPNGPRTLGIERVCSVKGGALYILTLSTDETLTGDGWTFGSRAAPNDVTDTDSLSAADEQRCLRAEGLSESALCVGDAGSD